MLHQLPAARPFGSLNSTPFEHLIAATALSFRHAFAQFLQFCPFLITHYRINKATKCCAYFCNILLYYIQK
jgi:hypothetical protein